jgi:hypothetical protein
MAFGRLRVIGKAEALDLYHRNVNNYYFTTNFAVQLFMEVRTWPQLNR